LFSVFFNDALSIQVIFSTYPINIYFLKTALYFLKAQ